MDNEVLEIALKRISSLEKKLEMYYKMLEIENELSFILKGTYIFIEDINSIMEGNY